MPEKLDYGLTPATASQARRCLAKITLGAVLAAANPAPAQQTEGPARTVTIPRGTYLRLATVKQLDPATQDRPLPARATVLVRISDDTRVQAGSSDLSDVMR